MLTCGAKTRVKRPAACQSLACSGALGADGRGPYSCPHLATHRPSPSSRRSAQACASRTSSWSSILSAHKHPGLLRIILSKQTVRKTQAPPRQRAPYSEDLTFRCRHSHFVKCATQLDPSEKAPSAVRRFTSFSRDKIRTDLTPTQPRPPRDNPWRPRQCGTRQENLRPQTSTPLRRVPPILSPPPGHPGSVAVGGWGG